jgi:hypothetical protein
MRWSVGQPSADNPHLLLRTPSPTGYGRLYGLRASLSPLVTCGSASTCNELSPESYDQAASLVASFPSVPHLASATRGTLVHKVHRELHPQVTLSHLLTHLGCVYNRSL